MNQAFSFFDTTIGKKVLMALSGLVLFGFVVGHMLGNLQLVLGPDVFNAYAVGLHHMLPLLWGARIILLGAIITHIVMALQLIGRSSEARPIPYRMTRYNRTTYAALTMKLSGFTLLFFVFYHLAHFTFPGVAMGAYEHQSYHQAYTNVVNGFSIPWVVALYVAAMVSLGFHLYHGSYSLFRTLGIVHPRRDATLQALAQTVALFVTLGNISLPLTVLLGFVR
jgi:succinate dehydrogenase / fumarate reductase, cytochrome b subunit